MYYSTTKKLGSKNQKKNSLPRVWPGRRQRGSLLRAWPMALGKEYLKKIKNLCRGPWIWALGKGPNPKSASSPNSPPTDQKKIFAEGLAWLSAKGVFAEGLANGPRQRIFKKNKKIFAEGLINDPRQRIFKKNKKIFAECLTAGTRQRLTPVTAVTHPAIFADGQFAEG